MTTTDEPDPREVERREIREASRILQALDARIPALQAALMESLEERLDGFRRYFLLVGVCIAMVAGVFLYQWHSDTTQRHSDCIRSNESRAGIVSAFNGVVDAAIPKDRENNPKTIAFRRKVAEALEPLAPRNC